MEKQCFSPTRNTTNLVVSLFLILLQFILVLRLPLALEVQPEERGELDDHAARVLSTPESAVSDAVVQPEPQPTLALTYHETWNASRSHNESKAPETYAPVVPPVETWLIDSPLRNQTTIPKIMYKAVLSHGGTFPDFSNQTSQLRESHESWMIRNPGYELRYFNLVAMRQYLTNYFHPVFLRAFDCIVPYAGKSDFFRVAVLYRDGGWYSDWKEVCLEDGLLDALSEKNKTLVFGWDRGTPHSRQNTCVMNAFLGATERHPMFEDFLRRVLLNVQAAHYGETPQSNTGPCVLGEAYLHVMEGNRALKRSMMDFKYKWNFYYFKSKKVIQHKCDDCGSWGQIGGNEYRELHESRGYYCPESPSILLQ